MSLGPDASASAVEVRAGQEAETVEYPLWLLNTLRVLMMAGVIALWVFPVPAGILSILYPVDGLVDSGGKGTVARPLLQALLLFCAVPFVLGPNAWRHWERSFRFAVLGLVMAWGLAAAFSVDRFDSSWTWMELFSSVVFMLLARQACLSPRGFDRFVLLAVGVGWTLAMLALWRHTWNGIPQEAVVGTFYQADVAAGYFLLLLPPALGLFVGHGLARFLGLDRSPLWLLHGVVFVILLATMILTYSRGAMLSIMVVFLVMLLVCYFLVRELACVSGKSVALAAGVLLLGVALALLGAVRMAAALGNADGGMVPQKVASRASELVGRNDSSVISRLDFWQGAGRMALARPLLGWGPSTFGRVYPRYQGDVRFYSRYTHSQYLTFLAEGGLLTLGAFLALLVVLWGLLRRRIREALATARQALTDRTASGGQDVVRLFAVLGLAGGLAAGLLHLVVDVDWEFPVVRSTWFGLAGVAVAAGAGVPLVRGPSSMKWRFLGAVLLLFLLAAQPMPWAAGMAEQGARAARESGDAAGAVAAMGEAVRWMPGSSLYRRELSECLVTRGVSEGRSGAPGPSLQQGVLEARRAVLLDPERAVNHEALGNALLASGDAEGAARSFRDALARDPVNYPGFYNVLATLEARAGRVTEALALLRVPAALYPRDIFTHMWGFRAQSLRSQLTQTWASLGRFQQQQGQAGEAAMSYARALELDGANIAARFSLGLLLMEQGNPGSAYLHFCDLLGRKPASPISMWLLGISCREMGQDTRALQLLDEAYRLKPDLRQVGEGGASLQIPPEFFQSGQKVPESHRLEPRG